MYWLMFTTYISRPDPKPKTTRIENQKAKPDVQETSKERDFTKESRGCPRQFRKFFSELVWKLVSIISLKITSKIFLCRIAQ